MKGRLRKNKCLKYPPLKFETPDQIIIPCPRPKITVSCKEPKFKIMNFTRKVDTGGWIQPDSQLDQRPPSPVFKHKIGRRNNLLKNPCGAGVKEANRLQPEIRRRARHFIRVKSNLDDIRAKDMTDGDSSCEDISPSKLLRNDAKQQNRKRKKRNKVELKDPDVQTVHNILPPPVERTGITNEKFQPALKERNAAEPPDLICGAEFANLSTPDLFASFEVVDNNVVPADVEVDADSIPVQQKHPVMVESSAHIPVELPAIEPENIPENLNNNEDWEVRLTTSRLEIRILVSTPVNNQSKKGMLVNLADDSPTYTATDRVPNILKGREIETMRLERLNL